MKVLEKIRDKYKEKNPKEKRIIHKTGINKDCHVRHCSLKHALKICTNLKAITKKMDLLNNKRSSVGKDDLYSIKNRSSKVLPSLINYYNCYSDKFIQNSGCGIMRNDKYANNENYNSSNNNDIKRRKSIKFSFSEQFTVQEIKKTCRTINDNLLSNSRYSFDLMYYKNRHSLVVDPANSK